MTKKEWIESATKGGWQDATHWYNLFDSSGDVIESAFNRMILQPSAWEAVSKIKGWKLQDDIDYQTAGEPEYLDCDEWKTKMANMIPYLINRGSLEEYIATL